VKLVRILRCERDTHASQCSKSGATKECSDSEIRRAQMHGAVEASMAWKIDLGYYLLSGRLLTSNVHVVQKQANRVNRRTGWAQRGHEIQPYLHPVAFIAQHPSIPSIRNLDTERQVSGLVHTCLCMASGRRQATNKPSMTCRKRPCRYFLEPQPTQRKGW
jgi:hypothetical protein